VHVLLVIVQQERFAIMVVRSKLLKETQFVFHVQHNANNVMGPTIYSAIHATQVITWKKPNVIHFVKIQLFSGTTQRGLV
jgi:hypothetical protein